MIRDTPSQTAEAVCLLRATDQRRKPEDRILDDPYARLFLGRLSRATLSSWEATGRLGEIAERFTPGLTTYVLARHRFIDDALRRALASGVEQLVLLGAGYDSRAYRFAAELAGRPVFEVDFPATSRRKARIVERHGLAQPTIDLRRVEIDFQTQSLDEELSRAGFQRGVRNFFVWEGVSMYLTRAAVKATLATIHGLSGPGTRLAMDFWYLLDAPDLLATAYRMSANLLSFLGEPVTFGIHPEDVGGFLERQGFRVTDLADAAELERRYVRDRRRIVPGSYLVDCLRIDAEPARTKPGRRPRSRKRASGERPVPEMRSPIDEPGAGSGAMLTAIGNQRRRVHSSRIRGFGPAQLSFCFTKKNGTSRWSAKSQRPPERTYSFS